MQTEELSVPGLGMRVAFCLLDGCGFLSSQGLASARDGDEQASQGGLGLAAQCIICLQARMQPPRPQVKRAAGRWVIEDSMDEETLNSQ